MPLEELRTKGIREVEASWQASELELPMEYDDTPDGVQNSDFLSPHKAPTQLSRSAAEWLASVSPLDEEGSTVIGPARLHPPEETTPQAFHANPPLSSSYPELPPAFSEAEVRSPYASPSTSPPPTAPYTEPPRKASTQPPQTSSTTRPATQPPPSLQDPAISRPATQHPSIRDIRPTPPPERAAAPSEHRSSHVLPHANTTSSPQDADQMLARALAMALAHQTKSADSKHNLPTTSASRVTNVLPRTQSPSSRGVTMPSSVRNDSQQQLSAASARSDSQQRLSGVQRNDSQQRLSAASARSDSQQRLSAASARSDSQQRLSAASARSDSQQRLSGVQRNTSSSASLRASRSQQKLPASQEPLTEENQQKLKALVHALDAALRKDATKPKDEPPLPPASYPKEDDAFASEALTGQFPVLSVETSDAVVSENLSASASLAAPSSLPVSSEKKNHSSLISEHTISQAAERLTAELRASLAFFHNEDSENEQEDSTSMINEILDIIAGNEQQDLSQATLTAILDQTLQNLQGPTSNYSSSIQESFTPASLEAYNSSVQIRPFGAFEESVVSTAQETSPEAQEISSSPPVAFSEDLFEERFKQAMAAYLRRQYKEALQLFEACLLLRPTDPRTLYNVERLRKRIPSG